MKRKKKNRGAYKFLQSSKWGPFWLQAAEKPQNGATLELRGGGGGGRVEGGGVSKGQGSRRESEEEGEEKAG